MNADPARRRAAQQRVERADQSPVGGDVDREHAVPFLRIDVVQRRQDAENAGVADEGVEPAPASIERLAQPVDRRHGRAGRAARAWPGSPRRAERADLVVELLERALGARERDDMGAGAREGERRRAANAAGGARSPGRLGLTRHFRGVQSTLLGAFANMAFAATASAPRAGMSPRRRCWARRRADLRGFMDLPNLKIKSKTTVRKAAAPRRRDAGVEGWRRAAAPWF